ncbi:hypothetical protein ACFXA3_22295 [Streptomyces sp. NPDC059456]|uniref:hypothetical protein n=1 Tax=Streptomyces sp. NPDC059456 TaxID=3346838 RepID=UPI0036CD494C
MVDIVEIYVHWHAGRPKNQPATSLGVDRKTIRKYLVPAEVAGMTPGGPPMSEADWAERIKSWFPTPLRRVLAGTTGRRAPSAPTSSEPPAGLTDDGRVLVRPSRMAAIGPDEDAGGALGRRWAAARHSALRLGLNGLKTIR